MTVDQARNVKMPDGLYPVFWRDPDGRQDYVKRFIRRGSIIDYFDDTFFSAVVLWKSWKVFGLPHGQGPLHERVIVTQMIAVVEEEANFYSVCDREEKRKKPRDKNK